MMKKHLAYLLGTALFAAPALAQTSSAPAGGSQPAAGAKSDSGMPATTGQGTSGGMSNQGTAQRPSTGAAPGSAQTQPAQNQAAQGQAAGAQTQYITQNRRDLWRASKLEGVDVYNETDEKIGDITEVLVNRQGNVEAVVIGVGGFLGMGQRDVAVPFNRLQWRMTEANTAAATTPDRPATGATGANTNTAASRTGAAPASRDTTGSATTSSGGITDTRYDRSRDYPQRAVLAGATKDQLKNAPEFKYEQ